MIILPAANPAALLKRVRAAIDAGTVRTWTYDDDGDFTHATDQWAGQAWLHPEAAQSELRMTIIPPENTRISSAVYAVYHGRFIEMVLRHFDTELNGNAEASARPTAGDQLE